MNIVDQKTLRLAVQELHDQAEKTKIAQSMIEGTISNSSWKNLCYQFFLITRTIEDKCTSELPEFLKRKNTFIEDVVECGDSPVYTCQSTLKYIDHLTSTKNKITGHLYANYLGWLYGGQMIAKKINLPQTHLKFENVKQCVEYMRSNILINLNETDIEEAKIAFKFIIDIYDELNELH
jgi:heme oxygenase